VPNMHLCTLLHRIRTSICEPTTAAQLKGSETMGGRKSGVEAMGADICKATKVT